MVGRIYTITVNRALESVRGVGSIESCDKNHLSDVEREFQVKRTCRSYIMDVYIYVYTLV